MTRFQSQCWQLEASIPDTTFEEFVARINAKAKDLISAAVLKLAKSLARENRRQEAVASADPLEGQTYKLIKGDVEIKA